MKRAASTPHAGALPCVDVQPFGSHHGDNLYSAFVQDQRIKHRSVFFGSAALPLTFHNAASVELQWPMNLSHHLFEQTVSFDG